LGSLPSEVGIVKALAGFLATACLIGRFIAQAIDLDS
jgi:hypothetical protein